MSEEVINLHVFNMITKINESKTLTKHISGKFKCNYDVRDVTQIKRGMTINVTGSFKNIVCVKKIVYLILLHVVVKTVNM